MTKAASSENVLPCAKSLNNKWCCSLDPNTEVPYPTRFSVTSIWFKTKSNISNLSLFERRITQKIHWHPALLLICYWGFSRKMEGVFHSEDITQRRYSKGALIKTSSLQQPAVTQTQRSIGMPSTGDDLLPPEGVLVIKCTRDWLMKCPIGQIHSAK